MLEITKSKLVHFSQSGTLPVWTSWPTKKGPKNKQNEIKINHDEWPKVVESAEIKQHRPNCGGIMPMEPIIRGQVPSEHLWSGPKWSVSWCSASNDVSNCCWHSISFDLHWFSIRSLTTLLSLKFLWCPSVSCLWSDAFSAFISWGCDSNESTPHRVHCLIQILCIKKRKRKGMEWNGMHCHFGLWHQTWKNDILSFIFTTILAGISHFLPDFPIKVTADWIISVRTIRCR